jgi:tRNA 2-selenouridine synthase
MPVLRLKIETFLDKSSGYPVIDVRSPAEYGHARIPGAFSLPVFGDDERAIIGTAYNQQGRVSAVNIGLNFFSRTMKEIQPAALKFFSQTGATGDPVFFVYCWRGGMRSGAIAWLLSLYGYKVYVLEKGYKSFRRWALEKFGDNFRFNVLGGFTGSGKTDILKKLKSMNKEVLDLEAIANHKGSAFGCLGMPVQPSQEMFENLLAVALSAFKQGTSDDPIWVEDESKHIGKSFIPAPLWETIRKSPFYFIDIPQEKRLDYIVSQYGQFDKEQLKSSALRISKRLGGAETKKVLEFFDQQRLREAFGILLEYYDKMYRQSLDIRFQEGIELHKISSLDVNSNNAFLL